MFYRTNLPGWERAARVVAGLLMAIGGLAGPGLAGTPVGMILVAAGAMTLITGFIGFLPGLRHGRQKALIKARVG